MSDRRSFEDQLRRSLRRIEPPPALEQRILRRADELCRPAARRRLKVAACLFALTAASLYGVHWRRQQIRVQKAEEARQQLVHGIEIAGRTLAKAEQRLRSIGVERIHLPEVFQ